jgi:SNF2 family DNA or RNA helicase
MASPFGYQERGIDFLAPRDRGILADEQGLGKTIQAILAADRAGARTTLVIAPAISLTNWSREWSRWQTDPRSIQVIHTGRDAQNLWGDVVIVSYTLATRLKDILRQRAYDLLIVDEA